MPFAKKPPPLPISLPFTFSVPGLNVARLIVDQEEETAVTLQSEECFPLPGGNLPWRDWVESYAPFATRAPFGEHHIRAWEWFEALTPGIRPPALTECWFRGGAKSTTVELATVKAGMAARRRFCLYVSGTQDLANNHVQTLAEQMEKSGFERALGQYRHSRGWKLNLLRSANGFNVMAMGLEVAARGLKLGFIRPDLIVLDDIDSLSDSADAVNKKLNTITRSILPAGSTDCAVVFIQNRIHHNSIMSRTLAGEADMLRRRVQSPVVVAVQGLKYKEIPGDDGRPIIKITGGTPTWEGKPLQVCEDEINTFGLASFLVECQDEIGYGGLFFDMFAASRDGEPWHVIEPIPIQPHWRIWASHDYGEGAPCCFLVYAIDELGDIYVIGEFYEAGHQSEKQADKVLLVLERDGLAEPVNPKARAGLWKTRLELIAFDHANTFPPDKDEERRGEYPVEKWWRKGLPAVRAVKDRKAGWRTTKGFLSEVVYRDGKRQPRVRFFRGATPNLIRTIAKVLKDPKDPEEIDAGFKDDHCLVAGTLVATDKGAIPIEQVCAGDRVMTRGGWQPVLWSGKVAETAPVFTARFNDGSEITGTSDHLVYVRRKGFVKIASLRYNDTVITDYGVSLWDCITGHANGLFSTVFTIAGILARGIGAIGTTTAPVSKTGSEGALFSIVTNGFSRMGRFLVDTKSIIKTATRSTTIFPTSNVCREKNTKNDTRLTLRNDAVKHTRNISRESDRLPLTGTVPRKVASGTGGTLKTSDSVLRNVLQRSATVAEKLLRVSRLSVLDSARPHVKPSGDETMVLTTWLSRANVAANHSPQIGTMKTGSVRAGAPASEVTNDPIWKRRVSHAVRRLLGGVKNPPTVRRYVVSVTAAGTAPVYDLHIDRNHEFFANGTLVHNCLDSFRYGLMVRPSPAVLPESADPDLAGLPEHIQEDIRRAKAEQAKLAAEEAQEAFANGWGDVVEGDEIVEGDEAGGVSVG